MAGLAAAGFAEDEHVGVGDRHRVVEDPAERVGVEAAAGQHVDAHLGAGRRQAGVEMNGHSTGAWSEVIRHVDTGAFAAAQPRPRDGDRVWA